VLKWAFEGKLTNENVKDGELPEGWKLQSINEIAVKITDGEHFRPKTQESGVPFLSAKDVRDHGVSFDDPLFISEKTASKALQRCNPEMGDILIVSRGATVGRMCIVNTNQTFCLLGSVILIKTKKEVDSRYITYILKSPFANQKMIAVSGATAQQAIYLRDIKNILIPIAPPSEQHRIVSEIETRLSVCDKLEESITQSLLQAEGLRQSILKKAFEGKLVPQSPNDEPACILLERIRAERAAMPAKNATRNKR
jgi:type I restriction enzyme S subunit